MYYQSSNLTCFGKVPKLKTELKLVKRYKCSNAKQKQKLVLNDDISCNIFESMVTKIPSYILNYLIF